MLVQLKKLNAPTRLESFNVQPSWKDLASKITQMFNIPSERVGVAYINETNDIVLFSDDEQLQWFYKYQPSEEIKFVVQDIQTLDSATTIASAWSAGSNISKSSDELTLCCWVPNISDEPFSVNIGKNKTVQNLKEAIKKMNEHGFTGIDFISLKLWKLSPPIPFSKIDRHVQNPEDIIGSERLNPMDDLSEHFMSPPRKHVHIIVQPPIREGLDSIYRPSKKQRRSDESEFDGTPDHNLAGLYRLFWGIADSDCFQERTAVIPDVRTLSVENVLPSNFTIITLRDGIVFPFEEPRLLVTSVYEKFWELITAGEKKWQVVQHVSQRFAYACHATIIKGQPGIGKTVFLSYVLVRRLQAKLPTVYCDSTECVHIFDDGGVTKVKMTPGSRISVLDANALYCALVNIGPQVQQPPIQFFPYTRRGRVVIATSPNVDHVKAFSKEWPSTSYCMPTWNWDELYFGSLLWKGTLADPAGKEHSESLRDVFTNYRGVPRTCLFLYTQNGMGGYESSVQQAIIEEFINSMKGLLPFKDNTSYRLVTIEPTLQSREQTSTEITSPHIARLLFKKFQQYQLYPVSRLIKNLLAFSKTRGPGGALFEQAVHHVFCKGITFNAEGMSTEAPNLEVSISAKDQEDSYFYHLQDIPAEKGSQDIDSSYLNRYMIPILKNQESIDSVWLSKDCTVLFRMTVSENDPLKSKGIRTLLNELPANANKDVRIVFVIPLGDKETSSFREQHITPEIGEAKQLTEEIENYPQYVYRFDYINRLSSSM